MDWDEIAGFLMGFPDTELTTTWNHPAIKTGGRLVAWSRDSPDSPRAVAIKVSAADLAALIDDPESPFFTIDHFLKSRTQAVLVRPTEADPDELRELLTEAWLMTAKPRARATWQDGT